MSNWKPGSATHTALIPGRRRENRFATGLAIGLAVSIPVWVFLGLAAWGGYILVKDIIDTAT
jgi:hypothetical protein